MRPVALAALLAAAAGLGGCEDSPSEGEREKARQVARTFLQTCAHGDGLAAQNLVTLPVRRRFVEAGSARRACAAVLGYDPPLPAGPASVDVFAATRIAALRSEGGFARAVLVAPDGERSVVALELVTGSWRLAGPLLR